jgi:hypothetical protein
MKIKLKIRLKICLLNIFVSFRPPGDTNREFSNHSSYRFFHLSPGDTNREFSNHSSHRFFHLSPGDTNREFSNHSSHRFFHVSNVHYSYAFTSLKRVERIEFFFELCSHVKEIEHV